MNPIKILPTPATANDDRIAGLSPEKRALLRERLARRGGGVPDGQTPRAALVSPGTLVPLSFAQQRLWFLDKWEGGGALYNIASAWWLEGALDLERLRGAFAQVVARHAALRTALVSALGEPRQQVLAHVALDLPCVDLRGLPREAARAQALTQAHALAGQGFALDRPPLLRVALYRVAESTHLLVLVIHHVVSDGWSRGVLCRELSACYAGEGAQLPALPLQYPDYAQWQRAQLQGAALERQLVYWRGQLADLNLLELPTDRPRPPAQSYRGASHCFVLAPALAAALRQISQRERVTPFMLLLATFQVLLSRYSGQDDIAVGSPIAGRTRSEFEGLIGFFVNTQVLRTDLSGNPRFCDLLARVRETALDAFAHQDVPFERLVEELKPERDPSRNPLVQVVFNLHNTPGGQLALPAVAVTPQELDTAAAKFDLSLTLTERASGLHAAFEYATDLFDAATIARMAGHFANLLEGIVADPATPIAQLPLLGPAEREQLLVQWNDTTADYPRDHCIHALFEQRARAAPEASALVYENTSLTYAELDARANQLARHLITWGVGPDVPVGICMERSLELVIGLLAILKAGGAYVPLDPDYPQERLGFMLADTQAPVLLTQHRLLGQLPPFAGRTLCLDRDGPLFAAQPLSPPPCHATAQNLAYIIYTSGSTGTPKGVAVTHRNVARLVLGVDYTPLGAQETLLLLAPLSFDASTFELWGALLHGARCVIYPQRVPTARELEAVIQRHGVGTLWLTAALFNAIIDERPAALRSLDQLLTGGETMSVRHAQRALAALPETRLVNFYGPTEGTTFTSCHPIPPTLSADCPSIPIGRPIANTQVYVLDLHLQPVPVGVAGELYIGGDGVARGYWNRPELSAERFVPDSFRPEAGARLYRTGDRVRWLADGNIEFLGRLDHQVKLRGFRIELGEIETALAAQPQVLAAVVVVREDTPGNQRLVAYVVAPEPAQELDAGALRTALRRKLPDYMIPAAFVQLPALPVTANGKTDRKALPAPTTVGERRPDTEAQHDSITEHLTRIWEIVLAREPIGVHENFFDLGGNSLLAVQLMNQIEKAFQRELPLDTLWFRGGTISVLAALIRDEYRSCTNSELVVLKGGSRRPLFVVHIVGGRLLHYYELSRHFDEDQPVYGLQARGVFGPGRPDDSVEATATHCVEAMRAAQPTGPYLLAGFSSGGVVAYEMAQQLTAAGEQVALLAMLDSYVPERVTARLWLGTLRSFLREFPKLQALRQLAHYSVLRGLGLGRFRRLRTAYEAFQWAHWSYRPRAYAHPIDFFIAADSAPRARRDLLGWSGLLKGAVRIHHLPGEHSDLVRPPAVLGLASLLQARIDSLGDE